MIIVVCADGTEGVEGETVRSPETAAGVCFAGGDTKVRGL